MVQPTARRSAARLAVAVVCVAASACRHDAGQPTQLIDGTPAHAPPVTLEGITTTAVTTVVRVGGVKLSCGRGLPAPGPGAIRRVGVSGSSITFVARDERAVRACDGAQADGWCGHAFAHIRSNRRLDPRLSLTCSQEGGTPLGFAWVQPRPSAAYVVVEQRGYAEVYPVAGSAPVRVTTADVDVAMSSARFDISEHAANGRRIRAYVLDAQISG